MDNPQKLFVIFLGMNFVYFFFKLISSKIKELFCTGKNVFYWKKLHMESLLVNGLQDSARETHKYERGLQGDQKHEPKGYWEYEKDFGAS